MRAGENALGVHLYMQPRYTQNTTEIQRKCICICNRNTTERHLYMQRVRYAYTKIRLYLIVVSCPILGLFLGAFPKPDHRGFPLLAANTQPRRESCHSKKTRIPISPWRRTLPAPRASRRRVAPGRAAGGILQTRSRRQPFDRIHK